MHECLYTSEAHQQCTGIQLTVLYIKAYLLLFFVSFCTFAGVHCKMPACQSAESVQNNTHQPTKTVQRKHCMQSTFEDDICCVSNIIVYDKVSDDFIFLSIKGTCPNQNLVAHHQFLDNLPGKASMQAFIYKVTGNLQGF